MDKEYYINEAFQLTTSRRGRLEYGYDGVVYFTFQLTTSRRGRRIYVVFMWVIGWNFNSLPHAEVDLNFHVISKIIRYFNSLPHAEVDMLRAYFMAVEEQFQLTTSRRGRPLKRFILSVLIVFQLTTSRRGRLYTTCQLVRFI